MTDLLLITGPINAGKSALANSLPATNVCPDSMRLFVTGRPDDFTREDEVWTKVNEAVVAEIDRGERVVVPTVGASDQLRDLLVEGWMGCPVIRLELDLAEFRERERHRWRGATGPLTDGYYFRSLRAARGIVADHVISGAHTRGWITRMVERWVGWGR